MITSCPILVIEISSMENTSQLYTFILYQLSDACTPINWADRLQAISFELMMKIDFVSAINIKAYHYPFSPESFNECLHVLTCVESHNSLYKITNRIYEPASPFYANFI